MSVPASPVQDAPRVCDVVHGTARPPAGPRPGADRGRLRHPGGPLRGNLADAKRRRIPRPPLPPLWTGARVPHAAERRCPTWV